MNLALVTSEVKFDIGLYQYLHFNLAQPPHKTAFVPHEALEVVLLFSSFFD